MVERGSRQQPGDRAPTGDEAIATVRAPAGTLVDQLYELLHEVIDPEVGVNIVDLGLVFEVTVAERLAAVRMTLTTPGCPLGGYMEDAIRHTLTRVPEIDDTQMDLVWEPAWGPHMMSEEAKRQLGWTR